MYKLTVFMFSGLGSQYFQMGKEPDYVIRSSLGEYVAAAVAGVEEAEDMLELVIKQALIAEEGCRKGGMTSVLYDPSIYEKTPQINQNSELASVNYNRHFVISGEAEGLKRVGEYLTAKGITYQELPVNYGFHSSSAESIESRYKGILNKRSFRDPQIPFISCVHRKKLDKIPQGYFWDVIREPIELSEAVRGIGSGEDITYIDLGVSEALAGFVKNITKVGNDSIISVITPTTGNYRTWKK
jgi:trans-AT polyketide synthase, acyltransferase and oxidoreductase domains